MAKILLLDDEEQIRRVIALHLGKRGHEVIAGNDGREGLDHLARSRFDLVLTDLRMPRVSGLELLKAMREDGLSTPVIVLTAYASIESAVEAMKLGAADYIGKPPQLDEITIKVANLLAQQALVEENRRLKEELEDRFHPQGIIGNSHAIKQVIEKVKLLARDPDIAILLMGESGTGKELIARTIHYHSPRAKFPFIAVNCGALPESLLESELFGHEKGAFTGAAAEKKGLFEAAHHGTLLLDEIDALPLPMQVKLLRALDDHEIRRVGAVKNIPVDLRIISASNQDLEQLVEEKNFRQDLYYRLAVATIVLPPLKERHGDLPLLVEHFLKQFNRAKNKTLTIDLEAITRLEAYAWPGNVRELEHLVEVLVVTAGSEVINAEQLPEKFKKPKAAGEIPTHPESLTDDLKAATKSMTAKFEREFILRQLEKHHWNITQTAQAIGLSRAALHTKMKEYAIGD
jgi:two-component system, NtrC family, response regulator AtoC